MKKYRVYVGLITVIEAESFEEAEDKALKHVKITDESVVKLEHKSVEGADEL